MFAVDEFYAEMQQIASEVLGEYRRGAVVYTTPETGGDTPYDPVTPGTAHTVNGAIATSYKASQYSERLSSATMRVVFPQIDPDTGEGIAFTPVEAGTLSVDGVNRPIVAVDRSLGGGDAIVWHVYVKG